MDCVFGFTPCILDLALRLLSHALHLKLGIAGQFACFALDAFCGPPPFSLDWCNRDERRIFRR